MPDQLVVVIAPADRLEAVRAQLDAHEIAAFADAEVLRALDAISTRRPGRVVLERKFARTSRGTALVNRLRADPALAAIRVEVVDHDAMPVRAEVTVPELEEEEPPVVVVTPVTTPAATPIDKWGTRRSPRVRVEDGVTAIVDGATVGLVDLSEHGAQVTSPAVLKPNQRLRFSLADQWGAVRCAAVVVWASFELPRAGRPGPHYRAGLEFVDAEAEAVTAFAARHRRPA